ncbi:MAG: hydroxyacid dehydrogenase [Rhodospirillales bacterium 20-60-12]|nr:MAG: hydroxyacid dehydrogenase [Rhodospirillales bacterium 20-60-12]HQT67441.1 FAD-binding oxidoreductase [Acetobacteraceae bacterium]
MDDLLNRLTTLLGPAGLLTAPSDIAPFCTDWRGLMHGAARAILRPASTDQVAQCVALCAEHGAKMVPQGGNTSMVAGATPSADGSAFILTLSRLNQVRAIDTTDLTMTIEAGVTLQAAQIAADDAGALLPLSISAEGSAQIGGVLATNAGGNNTLRYGNARDLVLGLEVVLADGRIWHGLRSLRKDNTGYCLRQLFVGSEGTLGIITAAVLKLSPRPRDRQAAFCAVPSVDAALALFARFRAEDASALQAFEYIAAPTLDLVVKHIPGITPPTSRAPHYVLIDLATTNKHGNLRAMLEDTLATALNDGLITDAALADSAAHRAAFWKLRENCAEGQKQEGASVKNDVSVPVSTIPTLLAQAETALQHLIPGCRMVAFGHIGDGNIHLNVQQPANITAGEFLSQAHDIMDCVNAIVQSLHGSFSAEHGIGKLKPYLMTNWRGGPELDMMHAIKSALDPACTLNPGTLLPPRP